MYQMDEYILNGQKAPKKRKGKGILVLLFFLFLLLAALCGAYWFYLNYLQETPKMSFFKYIGQNNFSNILNTDVYYTMLDKMSSQSFETETSASFTTTIKNEFTEKADVSKFKFNLNTSLDKENEASVLDAKIKYSSNDIFDLKLINTRDNVAIGSTEILDKYLVMSKAEDQNSIKKFTGEDVNIPIGGFEDTINTVKENRVNFDEEYKTQKINEYSQTIFNLIPEEAVTKNENIIVTLDSKTINAEAYSLSLDKDKYKEVLSTILNNLKNDKELLNKIVTNTKTSVDETEMQENQVNPLPNVQVEYTGAETELHQTAEEIESADIVIEHVGEVPDQTLLKSENASEIEQEEEEWILEEDNIPENESELFESLILAFIFNQKIETTVEDLISQIDTELNNINKLNEGIKLTAYVRNEEGSKKETIKVVAELPNKINVDIEYRTENKVKLTCLRDIEENGEQITEGYSVELSSELSDIKTKFDVQFSNIKNKKVIKKTQIQLDTEGSKASKDYNNEAIIKYNDSEGNVVKVNIANSIKFNDIKVEEILNDENAIFLDKLTEEETSSLALQIMTKIMQVYTEKVENLDFIDNNSSSSAVEQPTVDINNEVKNTVRQKLIETVSNMMGEAQNNGKEFTIQNLKNLKIEGLNVSTVVTEEMATIKIEGFTFTIDKNFMLSE